MKRLLLAVLFSCFALVSGCDKAGPEQASADTSGRKELIDVDMTDMNYNIMYAELYAILSDPASYDGKTIRMPGTYSPVYYEETGLDYHYVGIYDETACCQIGLEFKTDSGLDYPDANAIITVTGTMDSYEELGETYYYLAGAEMELE